MSVKAKMAIASTLICVLIVVAGVVFVQGLKQYQVKTERLTVAVAQVNNVHKQRAELMAFTDELKTYFETKDPNHIITPLARLSSLDKSISELKSNSKCPICKTNLNVISLNLKELRSLIIELDVSLLKGDEADSSANQTIIERISRLNKDTSARLSMVAKMISGVAVKYQKENQRDYRNYSLLMLFASIIIIIIGIGASHMLAVDVATALNEFNKTAGQFADGNRSKRIEAKLPQEFQPLANTFNTMATAIESSEQNMQKLNIVLRKEVGKQKNKLALAHQETEQKIEEIEAYIKIAETLNSAPNLDDMLGQTAQTLSSVLGADYVTIALIDEDVLSHCWEVRGCKESNCPAYKATNLECWTLSQTFCKTSALGSFENKIDECTKCEVFQSIKLSVKAAAGTDRGAPIGQELPTHDSLCGKALLTLAPVIETNLNNIASITSLKTIISDCGTQGSFPLVTKNRVLGTVNIGYRAKTGFSDNKIALIESTCNQIAIGIDNAGLFEQAKKSANNFSVLYRAGDAVTSTLELKAIAKHVLQFAMQLTEAQAGLTLLYDEKTHQLKTGASKNIDKETTAIIRKNINKEFIRHTIEAKEPFLIDMRYNTQHYELGKICSAIFVPLQLNGQLFGCIGVISYSDRFFNYSDLQLVSTLSNQTSTAMHNAYLFNQLEDLYIDTVKAFVQAIEAKDSYTRGHSENVAAYAKAIARKTNLAHSRIKTLETAALLHDIGKIGIKEEILNKPERLTPEEFDRIKQHPHIAFQILEHVPALKDVARIIQHHHEKYDGTGYPAGLKGENIPLESRILTVADTFDAMTSSRPYRQAESVQSAKAELLRNMAAQFDPEIVEAFIELLDNGEFDVILNKHAERRVNQDSDTDCEAMQA